MKKFMQAVARWRFIIFLLIALIGIDESLAHFMPSVIEQGYVKLNNYEVTVRDHPEKVWDKVFVGSSSVIASYREDLSDSGYINIGMDDLVITDLWQMISKKEVTIGSEMVIGVDWLTFYDHLMTNPSYPWHRAWYVPYSYFRRDSLKELGKNWVKSILTRQPMERPYANAEKSYYYGTMPPDQLQGRIDVFEEKYWHLPLSDFSENMTAFRHIIDYCQEKGICLRLVWMPLNPSVEEPELIDQVKDMVNGVCQEANIEVLDLTDAFGAECFYDLGHLNYEYGSHVFTKEIDPWLNS